MNNKIIGGVAIVGLVLAVFGLFTKNTVIERLGAVPGNDFTSQINIAGGQLNSGVIASSSLSSSLTLSVNEFKGWANAALVSYTPGLAGLTITLPASTTVSGAVVPRTGDSQSFCLYNATTTAGTVITFAGGVGTLFNVASSSATALGSSVIRTGETGCFRLIRGPLTASAYDINVLFSAFQ